MGKVVIKLLESKNVHTTQNNVLLDAQNNYKVIAGEDNATEFVIEPESDVYDKQGYVFKVGMVNAFGTNLPEQIISNKSFTLPKEMAVPGYTHLYISATLGDIVVRWMFVKIKVWSYLPDWSATVSNTAEQIIIDTASEALAMSAQAKSIAQDVENRVNSGELDGKDGKDGKDGIDGAGLTKIREYSTPVVGGYIDFEGLPTVGDVFWLVLSGYDTNGNNIAGWAVLTARSEYNVAGTYMVGEETGIMESIYYDDERFILSTSYGIRKIYKLT